MEMELKNLINKIKKDGIQQAESDANAVIEQAQAKASQMIEDANKQKEGILKEAELSATAFRASTEQALKQSARDALLSLRDRVGEFFARVVKEKVKDELTQGALKDIIVKTVDHCVGKGSVDIEILVNDKDKATLEKELFSVLAKDIKDRVTVKSSKAVDKGFRIGEKGKDSYLDFTASAIAEGFRRYLNPKLIETLDIDLGLK